MGIQGLLPFLKKIHTPVNVAQFQGCTVAIDAYCWLHKGAFACADKLALGEKTDQYVYYCMKYVDYLLRNGLKPILVFDGCHLPSKKDVETSRREKREMNRKRAAQLLREGKRAEARECLQRCVDITPQMALELMNVCRARGVDCIVAPYEADAQLAYLNKAGIAQIIITEDSDLLLFGCEKVIFKMDFFGNGVLIERSRLNEVVDIQDGFYTFDKFRYMCILSGCDYLPSLPGIGLAKACKVFKVARQTDIRQVLKKLPSYLKMNIVVPNEYVENFVRADNTFLYQLAFDPIHRTLCPLNPYPPEISKHELTYAGPYFPNDLALQISLGNIDIHTHERISDFDPNTYKAKYAKKQGSEHLCMLSIWNPSYRPLSRNNNLKISSAMVPERPSLAGKEVQVKNSFPKRSPVKRVRSVEDSTEVKTDAELANMYSAQEPKQKKPRHNSGNGNIAMSPKQSIGIDDMDSVSIEEKNSGTKRQILSPSKLMNQLEHEMDDFQDTDSDTTPKARRRLEDVSTEEKENGKALTPRKNKFAISALAKRAKFSLDAPSPTNVKVEVKSRYFGSSATPPSSKDIVDEEPTERNGKRNSGVEGSDSVSIKEESPVLDTDTESTSSLTESAPFPENMSTAATSLSKFSHSSSPGQLKQCPRLKSQQTAKNSSNSSKSTPKSSITKKASPGSAFNWSMFKFAKSSSTPDLSSTFGTNSSVSKAFKRVSSGNGVAGNGERTLSSQPNPLVREEFSHSVKQRCAGLDDSGDAIDTNTDALSQSEMQNSFTTSASSQASEVDSTAGLDASQRSNLYSIDSDCFPTSQDFVDLTDTENDSQQTLENEEPVDRSDGGGGFKSPSSASKVPFMPPKSTRLSDSGVTSKKCRVSGLARGKKKTTTGVDEKQQKIKDMFSRFAHQKNKQCGTSAQQQTPSPGEVPSEACTPSDSMLSYSTTVHRKLCL